MTHKSPESGTIESTRFNYMTEDGTYITSPEVRLLSHPDGCTINDVHLWRACVINLDPLCTPDEAHLLFSPGYDKDFSFMTKSGQFYRTGMSLMIVSDRYNFYLLAQVLHIDNQKPDSNGNKRHGIFCRRILNGES